MKKMFMAVIAFMMTISASAQFYFYFSDGTVAKLDSISIVAPEPSVSIGVFSVASNKQVSFSKGNLQYIATQGSHRRANGTTGKGTWRFATNQWDYIGEDNSNISMDYDGWIDLFGWGTGEHPTIADNYYTSYPYFIDWGDNQIERDAPGVWYTMKNEEWEYLLSTRENASNLHGIAQVNGVNGLILLPDNWTCPEGISFKTGCHSSYGTEYYEAYQSFTADQWSKMELEGAVFLPAAGGRTSGSSTQVDDILKSGYYWANTGYENNSGYMLYFDSQNIGVGTSGRQAGMSVRLVKNVE